MRQRPRFQSAARRDHFRRLLLEHLETRDLLVAGSWTVQGNTLVVQGTSSNDDVVLSARPGGRIALSINGQRSGPHSVQQVVVYAQSGNDGVRVEGNLSLPLEIHGGAGRDRLLGGAGPDKLFGDAGDDQLYGFAGNDVLEGGAAQDLLFGGQGSDQLAGGDGNDQLFGEDGNDVLRGGAGNDNLYGAAGSDVLEGGNGTDLLFGGLGPDRLAGGIGNDQLHGEGGDDSLNGGAGNDNLFGSIGSDVLVGEGGDDGLYGGPHADIAIGGPGHDRILGESGKDLLIGGDGADILDGGPDDDLLVAGQTVYDTDLPVLRAIAAAANLGAAGKPRLDPSTVVDDQDADRLLGGGGWDLFLAGSSDRPVDRAPRETAVVTGNTTAALVNRAVATKAGVQQMPSVAVNPKNSRHVVIAYMDYSLVTTGYAGIGVATSVDGGLSWRHSALQLPAGFEQGAANPIARFDDAGHAFVSFMAATFLGEQPPLTYPDYFNNERMASDRALGLQANNGVFVARSDDGGLSWNEPVAVVANRYLGVDVPFDFNSDLGVDTFSHLPNGTPNSNYGNLYVTWSRAYPVGGMPGKAEKTEGGLDLMIAVSRDGGRSWQTQLKEKEFWIDANGDQVRQEVEVKTEVITVFDFYFREFSGTTLGQGYADQARVTVGPEGDVYVSAWTGGSYSVQFSHDAGASFELPDHSDERWLPFGLNFDVQPDAAGLPNNHFRTFNLRAIAADPARPGQVYAAESILVKDVLGTPIDGADIFFARSTDHGENWQRGFQVGPNSTQVLNDDNDGMIATGAGDEQVIAGQAMPRLAVDAQGNIAVIWYDTRRDPADHLLDVFGTVSTDGGQTFSPNFRISGVSFDADAGSFTDATGGKNFYLGDYLGLTLAGDVAYAAWTDTRNGNQDIFFTTFPIASPLAPLNDRFEPNNTPDLNASPTDLGRVIDRHLPKLTIEPGDKDWFLLEAAATGTLTISASQANIGDHLRLELWNKEATKRLAVGTNLVDEGGHITGKQLAFPSVSGQEFLVRVLPATGSPAMRYSLDLQSLTADLGTRVHGVVTGSLESGGVALYRLAAGAPGSLEFQFTSGANVHGDLKVEVLDLDERLIASSGGAGMGETQHASLAVRESQAILLRVSGESASRGDFTLEFTNLDQFTTPEPDRLLFSAGAGPSQAAYADFNKDSYLDLVVSNALSNTVSVLTGNQDGTFQAPRQFAIGAFVPRPSDNRLPAFRRDVVLADLNSDGNPDVLVTNEASSDISVLLGRGDGTFDPHRRFDATPGPFALDVGDLNHDAHLDVVAVNAPIGEMSTVAVLLGRGDGTFAPQQTFSIFPEGANPVPGVSLARLNADDNLDLIISGDNSKGVEIFLGNGDGKFTFRERNKSANREAPETEVADVNGDGLLDIVVASLTESGEVSLLLGNGDGSFEESRNYFAGQAPIAVEVVDFGSAIVLPEGAVTLGPPDGRVDLVVAVSGLRRAVINHGDPGVMLLPGQFDDQGQFLGFGAPIRLLTADSPIDLDVHDTNGDGVKDIAVVDRDGIVLIFGQPPSIVPNDTPQSARDLGTVVHVVEPKLTITPVQREAWYRLTVPTEAVLGAGDQVLDFSGGFAHEGGLGLAMEVTDVDGNVLGQGERFRVTAAQGQKLLLHVFGQPGSSADAGVGAYSLVINVLPQVVAVESQSLLTGAGGAPGGPTTSIVLTLQGDRLDPASAIAPAHYQVTWLGPDGHQGGGDDQQIPLSTGVQPVVYSPGSNVEIGSGRTHPTAIRQTVTLLFDAPLPVGSYQIELAPQIQTADFNADEDGLLAGGAGFQGHPLSHLSGSGPQGGVSIEARDLVFAAAGQTDFSLWNQGTPFLSQLHDDLGAVLDSILTSRGDDLTTTAVLNDLIKDRIVPGLGADAAVGVLVIWLDPTSIGLTGPVGSTVYNPVTDVVTSTIPDTSVILIGNIEVIVIATTGGAYDLAVNYVSPLARGGIVFAGPSGVISQELTGNLRTGETQFNIRLP